MHTIMAFKVAFAFVIYSNGDSIPNYEKSMSLLDSLNFIEMIFFYNIFNLKSIEIFLESVEGNETKVLVK